MRYWIPLFLLGNSLFAAQPTLDADLKTAVSALHERYIDALKKGDPAAFAALFNANGMVLTSGAPMIQGQAKIQRDREALFARAKIINGALRPSHLEQSGDLAYEVGRFSYTIQVDDQPQRIIEGKYLTIWKRDTEGQWRYQVDAGIPD